MINLSQKWKNIIKLFQKNSIKILQNQDKQVLLLLSAIFRLN
jgi:hypothetical protein